MTPLTDEITIIELKADVKEVNADGTFSGIASVYGVEDLTGDIIDKGAFKKTLSESPTVPVLWQHQSGEVIGEGTLKEWQGKILIDGYFDMEDPTAQKAYRKLKNKLIKGLSIGFQTIKSTWEDVEGRMIRHITELKLYEVSVVTFAALPSAQVTRVKSADANEARIKTLEEQVQALQAKAATPLEPAVVEEPPSQQGIEPAKDHSALLSKIQELKGAFQWNPSNSN